MEFCECGSVRERGNCTNKICKHHVKSLVEAATYKQIEYIRNLGERLGEDLDSIDFESLSKKEAKRLIDDYLERLDIQSDGYE
jgi:hypothetical protein